MQPLSNDRIGRGSEESSHVLRFHLGFLLNKAAQAILADVNASLVAYGLDAREYGVLLLLSSAGPLKQTSIGERAGIDRTTMVAIIDSLEANGLVARKRHPDDRRAYAVTLTLAGERTLEEVRQVVARTEEAFVDPLTVEERDHFVDSLLTLVDFEGGLL